MCRRHRLQHGRRNNAASVASYGESLLARALTRLRLPAGRPPVRGADRKGIMLSALAVLAIA